VSAYDAVDIAPPPLPDTLLILIKTFPAVSMPKFHDAPPYSVAEPNDPPVAHLEIK
jgi:hypothetical protein